ncbi:hypothetical protein Tco_0858269 [Tanacetum coccineum]|uniref:Uncharacterized protein n=1 Tax=Tanacetum coccineum TaxID=301880 RepID=A0ABQ5BBE9_9ASTR
MRPIYSAKLKLLGLSIIAKLALVVCYEWMWALDWALNGAWTFLVLALNSADSRGRACCSDGFLVDF